MQVLTEMYTNQTGRNRVNFIAFSGNPSDNPFTFPSGFVLVFNDGLLSTYKQFVFLGVDRTGETTAVKNFVID